MTIPASSRPVILHLSDIHRTQDEPVSNEEILLPLIADIRSLSQEGIPKPNIVVLSGDLTQKAIPSEYNEAKEFVAKLLDELSLSTDSLILVPGNHDIHWPTCYDTHRLRPSPPEGLHKDYVINSPQVQSSLICADSADAYQKRLDNFRNFHKDIYNRDYPRNREEQYTIHRYEEASLGIIGFNSCDLNDHYRFSGRIHPAAISAAAAQASGLRTLVAVWHHDFNWLAEPNADALDIDSIRFLSMRSFAFGLCGHSHRPADHNVKSLEGFDFPVIAAGSLCAGQRQRKDSVPRAYNIVAFHEKGIRVHVRNKDDRSSPWRAYARFKGAGNSYVGWYDIQHPSTEPAPAEPRSSIFTCARVRAATPFAEVNAKNNRLDVVREYVWTDIAKMLDSDAPQIVLGPRGAGKTALLLSLTFDGRRANIYYARSPEQVLARIGLLCPMRVLEFSAFYHKGWLQEHEREDIFRAVIGTLWAEELLGTLESTEQWCKALGMAHPSQAESCNILSRLLFYRTEHRIYGDFSLALKELRHALISVLAVRDDGSRAQRFAELSVHPLVLSGPGLVADIAGELCRWAAFQETRWIIMFDEVEFLTQWQQRVVYSFLATLRGRVSAKVATLPYAHAQALSLIEPRLLEGSDYTEIPMTLTAHLEFQTADIDGSTKDFIDVVQGMWKSRLESAGIDHIPIEDVWGEWEHSTVLAALPGRKRNVPKSREELEDALIGDLKDGSALRAKALRGANPQAFSDQYWRKYQQPFRFRLAQRLSDEGTEVPLYWGWKAMLRACDGNCRWFLQLADQCWRLYWKDGVRPLKPDEQDRALRQWASSVYRTCGGLTQRGEDLKGLVDRVAVELSRNLYGKKHLSSEMLSIRPGEALPFEMAQAVAVGIAHGHIVPRLQTVDNGSFFYPTSDVSLRLGFPIAVAKRLPLRSGTTLHIQDLRQVEFPWPKV
ncbi:metallophosphoesterase [Nannocystis sp. SCPEA4]|uniref:metallophosphoesterase family protein n=1 Tax=Nannocystis sp. SCPEA4 TaxID=2996787 RepID=UPI002270CE54|nr:metallophosphoesterase [Nannocystis sp. SCPEA4]MCY1059055.1 metallophosphoesterase [Nannocystis sp. SCPEA4]